MTTEWLLPLCIFLGAALYSSVGHAGASAYIALMALFGIPAAVMRPTALVLNVIVATFTSGRFVHAGLFRWRTLWPFLIGAIPMAFVGGMIVLPGHVYRPLVGVVLWLSAARLLWPTGLKAVDETRDPPLVAAIPAGAAIGLLSGLTGTGGGIFLSPLLLFLGWSTARPASGVAAVFILVNSIAGIAGNLAALGSLPPSLPIYAIAALAGAAIGTTAGIKLSTKIITRALAAVLVIAGAKMIGVY
ncbi:hypothetical protein SAMN05216382_2888 [Sphingomonas palmae]|uniref:Probable membrane transporter protein n=1 Tax=Sphingomonas palmae TaxID=1855283 RepID=A0A1H7U0X4_9SPHN|nr:sulfite exporter TauE/SafE family protein [Sphingomonas palmae]SEL90348.1 hypothetical protein SAMN05216382_2888 [Sphingomonas palmae]